MWLSLFLLHVTLVLQAYTRIFFSIPLRSWNCCRESKSQFLPLLNKFLFVMKMVQGCPIRQTDSCFGSVEMYSSNDSGLRVPFHGLLKAVPTMFSVSNFLSVSGFSGCGDTSAHKWHWEFSIPGYQKLPTFRCTESASLSYELPRLNWCWNTSFKPWECRYQVFYNPCLTCSNT